MAWQTLEEKSDSRRPWTVAVSFLAQCLLVCLAILVPLLATEEPRLRGWMPLSLIPPREPLPTAPPQAAKTTSTAGSAVLRFDTHLAAAPAAVPPPLTSLAFDAPAPVSVSAWTPGGIPGGVLPGPVLAPPSLPKPPIRERREPAAEDAPILVGGDVQAARLIRKLSPAYPLLARQARVSGAVRLEAIIDPQGKIQKLRVLSGHPLLVTSALEAVRQWRYRPTLLNGSAVSVITYIDVNFTLTER